MRIETTVATVMGSHSEAIRSKYNIRATPGGMKKKAMFEIRNRQTGRIVSGLTIFRSSRKVSSSIPKILPGMLSPGMRASNSPKARQPKIIPNCFAMMSDGEEDMYAVYKNFR